MKTFPTLLKSIREEAGLTQIQMASVLGVSTVLISMVETGKKEVSKSLIYKLSFKLGVHPSSIVPFLFIEEDFSTKKLSGPEKQLISIGDKLQDYLIKVKAKKLKSNG